MQNHTDNAVIIKIPLSYIYALYYMVCLAKDACLFVLHLIYFCLVV